MIRPALTTALLRYHAPSDDVTEPVDLKAAAGFNRILLRLTESIARQAAQPKVEGE